MSNDADLVQEDDEGLDTSSEPTPAGATPTRTLVAPEGSVIPDALGFTIVEVANLRDFFRLNLSSDMVLIVPPRLLNSLASIEDDWDGTLVELTGCPNGQYSVSWEQATVRLTSIDLRVLQDEKERASDPILKKVSRPDGRPVGKTGFRRAPDPSEGQPLERA